MSAGFVEWRAAGRRPEPPRINWYAVAVVVGSALAFFAWKGLP